jgi:hypothetical protein
MPLDGLRKPAGKVCPAAPHAHIKADAARATALPW